MRRSAFRSAFEAARTVAGLLSLAATLALLSPGVNAVRADDEPAAGTRIVPAQRAGKIEASPRPAEAPSGGPDGVVVLNTRGYNYGPERPTVSPTLERSPTAPAAPADE